MFDIKLAKQLAELGRIAFEDNELAQMTEQMAHIIQLMDKVKEFSAPDSEPRVDALPYESLRTDEAKSSLETEKIIQNAEKVKGNSFVVPKVV